MALSFRTINFPDDRAVAIDGERRVAWGEFRAMIAARQLASSPRRRLLLDSASPLDFVAGLLAALVNDHVAVIPPNFQAQTLAAFAELPAPLDAPPQTIELYTSGSSGEPKCVRKTLRQLEAECDLLERCWGDLAAAATVIATTPHHHIYGLLFRMLWPLLAGRPVDNSTIAEPTALTERLRVAETAVLVSSPAQLSRLHQLLDLAALPHKPLLTFSSGGPLNADTAALYQQAWGAAPIEVYGSTESGGIAWRRQDLGLRWTPLPQVQLDTDTDGALLVRSPFLPDETPLRMEDAAEFDADGTFVLRGRLDRIVKIEEKRLSLPEMEAWLSEHPEVGATAVAPLTLSGRTVVGAVVALKSDTDRKPMIAALRKHLRQRFDNVLLPRRWRFVDALPFNERGKLAQAEVARLLEAAP
jgi:acyl-coenzyme A synthetase/AMP-(fatty) acid ligase